jgi:hypothetical protein
MVTRLKSLHIVTGSGNILLSGNSVYHSSGTKGISKYTAALDLVKTVKGNLNKCN